MVGVMFIFLGDLFGFRYILFSIWYMVLNGIFAVTLFPLSFSPLISADIANIHR